MHVNCQVKDAENEIANITLYKCETDELFYIDWTKVQ